MKLYRYTISLLTSLSLLSFVAKAQETEKVADSLAFAKKKNWQNIFLNRPALFFDRNLMGEETGVYMTTGGFIGNSGNLFIRGLNTVNLNASPYAVLRGLPVRHTRRNTPFVGGLVQNNWGFINPLDVRTVKIIKNGYEASFYGGKAGNGMIELDFDRGAMGSATIDFIARLGFSQADYSYDMMNGEQFRSYLYNMMEDRGILPTDLQQMNIFNPEHPKYSHRTNWMDQFQKNGFYQDYNLKMKGGDGDTRYLFSLGYAAEDETLEASDYQRFNMRFNLDYKISPKISISNSLSYNYSTQHFHEEGINWDMHPVFLGLTKAPFLSEWLYTDEGEQIISYDGVDELGKSNPVLFNKNMTNKGVENRVDAIIQATWDFLPGTSLNTDIDISYNSAIEKQHRGSEGIVQDKNRERQNSKRTFSEFLIHWDIALRHKGKIAEDIRFESEAGLALESYNEKMVYGRTVNAATDEIESLKGTLDSADNTRYDYKQINFFINGKIMPGKWGHLAANLNLERSSNFGPDGSWNLYAGVELSLNLLHTKSHWTNLNIQWGRAGNNDIREAYYSQLYAADHYYGYGGVYLKNLYNNNIKPEITDNINATLHTALWNNRLELSIGYYLRKTHGLLTQRALPIELGLDPQFENNGKIANRGFEIAANVNILNSKKWNWSVFANITTLHNEVNSLPNGDIVKQLDKFTSIAREGEKLGSFYGYKVKGIYRNESEISLNRKDGLPFLPGDYKFENINGDNLINEDDRQVIGSPLPDFFGGFGTTLTYRNITLNALFSYSYGNDVYNLFAQRLSSMQDYSNQSAAVLERWISEELPGNGHLPRAAYGDPSDNFETSDRWIEDGSYLKLKSISLSYDVPLRNRGGFVKGINVFANANNLFTVTGYNGCDPETFLSADSMLRGIDTGASPTPRSYIFGIKLSL